MADCGCQLRSASERSIRGRCVDFDIAPIDAVPGWACWWPDEMGVARRVNCRCSTKLEVSGAWTCRLPDHVRHRCRR